MLDPGVGWDHASLAATQLGLSVDDRAKAQAGHGVGRKPWCRPKATVVVEVTVGVWIG